MHLHDLYREVSLHYSNAGIEVLAEWIRAGTESQLLDAVDLLSHGPNDLVFERQSLVTMALDRAAGFGSECHRRANARFVSLASSGMRSGPAGEPYPQDIALRNRCDELLRALSPDDRRHRLFTDIRQQAQSAIKRELAELEEE